MEYRGYLVSFLDIEGTQTSRFSRPNRERVRNIGQLLKQVKIVEGERLTANGLDVK